MGIKLEENRRISYGDFVMVFLFFWGGGGNQIVTIWRKLPIVQ